MPASMHAINDMDTATLEELYVLHSPSCRLLLHVKLQQLLYVALHTYCSTVSLYKDQSMFPVEIAGCVVALCFDDDTQWRYTDLMVV